MNDGKICVSVCATTAAELSEKLSAVKQYADLIEIRFDCFEASGIEAAKNVPVSVDVVATFRANEQGGKRELSYGKRADFWLNTIGFKYVDLEEDVVEKVETNSQIISSFHDFVSSSADVREIYERLSLNGAAIVKIAVRCDKITDAIPLWKLLVERGEDAKPFIPVAMGEAGKWTRILGLAHGAFLTFAAPDEGSETAPGQISALDMRDVFRVRELDKNTQVFGIVAGDTSYSVSPWMHNAAFKAAGMNRVFVPLQVTDLDEFLARMVKPETREVNLNFSGFSVTNPHKQAIMRHLYEIDATATAIGAVNTVRIGDDGKLYGFNTDAPGFIAPLKEKFRDMNGMRAAVVGAGGAARACIYALKQEGVEVSLYARDVVKSVDLAKEMDVRLNEFAPGMNFDTDILVNSTPLGTKGKTEDQTIAHAAQLARVKLVYDLIYNPIATKLSIEAERAGVEFIGGLDMLIAQGAKQFEIWTGGEAPFEAMSAAVKKKLNL